jgi:GTPase SAR1 family protein
MDVTIVGLQNAGKTSLLRVLAVSDLSKTLHAVTGDTIVGVELT